MKSVSVIGWTSGFQKIEFTELLRRELGFSLSAAKSATDSVLENRPLNLQIPDDAAAQLLRELEASGARIQVVEHVLSISA